MEVNRVFTVFEPIDRLAVSAELGTRFIDPDSKFVRVQVNYFDQTGKKITEEYVTIDGLNYDLLMSESPEFAPGKPANEYREIDLWYMINQIKP